MNKLSLIAIVLLAVVAAVALAVFLTGREKYEVKYPLREAALFSVSEHKTFLI